MRQHTHFRNRPCHGAVGHSFLTSGIKQLEINARLGSHADPADQHIPGRNRPPVSEKKLCFTGRIAQHVAPADRRELATASQIRIDNLSDIFRRRTDSLPGKRHHRNGRGILHSLIDFDLQLCAGGRCQQQRK